jgi:cell shape-determining protein MreC
VNEEVSARDFGRLEAEVEALRKELSEHKLESRASLAEQSAKIDELLELANKGKGAFWIAALTAGGLGSLITLLLKWWLK